MPLNNPKSIKKSNFSAALVLENGLIFWGYGMGSKKKALSIGELCFNTSTTGYQEILTDPSYAKQIITFTFPHIGIVGTNPNDQESRMPFASGCVISSSINDPSNWRSKKSLNSWLVENDISCITNVDTRYITQILSKDGPQKAGIVIPQNKNFDINNALTKINKWEGLENLDLAREVTIKKSYSFDDSIWNHKENKFEKMRFNSNSYNVVCMDYGAKKNIFRSLTKRNLKITILPADSSFEKIVSYEPKGIFLSNGPGDPFATGKYAVSTIKKLIKINLPIFGICLGHQLLCLALGGKTKKMHQGHRGANHPVKNLETNKVEITSQNHGFEVLFNSLPKKEIIETHKSLFDQTNEGIKHKHYPIFSVQYHPEASPGPHDSNYLFDQFYNNIKNYAKKN